MDLDTLAAEAKDKICHLIQKPSPTVKLLQKPPFRFLHDVVSAITEATGFAKGLFEGDELNGFEIEKQAKINYLNKIVNLVGICKVRASKLSISLSDVYFFYCCCRDIRLTLMFRA